MVPIIISSYNKQKAYAAIFMPEWLLAFSYVYPHKY